MDCDNAAMTGPGMYLVACDEALEYRIGDWMELIAVGGRVDSSSREREKWMVDAVVGKREAGMMP